ncbi:hypothetical protein BGZ83_002219 [Gryganskiella cystojenkinii]|nr:hypothetical protein BGZ83_002219 [Gryganskiella cystojenkinii]
MLFSKSLLVSALLLAVLSVSEAGKKAPAKPSKVVKGQVGALENSTNFSGKGTIAENEDRAVAYCTKPLASAPGAGLLPAGFIKSANFVQNTQAGWKQITGRMDGKKFKMDPKDGGGQYDVKAPVGAKCAGFNYFVELVEPDSNIYCIRCCKTKSDCPVNKSTYGCKKILGGNYA